MKQILVAVALLAICLVPGVSQAVPIFTDNFDGENGGATQLNYNAFAKWTVSGGTVDLIGAGGPYNFLPGNGLYVDLDGSTNDAGIMTSSQLPVVVGDSYELTFEVAGSQRSFGDVLLPPNQLTFGIDIDGNGSIDIIGVPNPIALGTSAPFTTFTLPFTATALFTDPRIILNHNGGDNRGMLLDRVAVNPANLPEPASLMLLGAGLAAIGIWRRKAAKG